MRSIRAAVAAMMLTALLGGCGGGGGGESAAPPPVTTALPRGNVFAAGQSVTLQAPAGTVTYYTLDGGTPTENSTRYTGPISVSASADLKFFSVDAKGIRESPKTESYRIATGTMLRLVASAAQPLAGLKVVLTLPVGVSVATNGDGSVASGVILPSAGNYQTATVLSFPGASSYDPVNRLLSFYLVSSAPGGLTSGEFAAIDLQVAGSLPAAGDFAAILSGVDLAGNVLADSAANPSFLVGQ